MDKKTQQFLLLKLEHSRIYREGLLACCPWHKEDTPSFFIYFDEKQSQQWWFKCHGQGCGKAGPLDFLLAKLKGHQFIRSTDGLRALSPVNERTFNNYNILEERYLIDDTRGLPDHYEYYYSRGISAKICKKFNFKYEYKNPGAVMPVYFLNHYQGYIKRNLDPSIERYYISPGLPINQVLWGYDEAINYQTVYITEGIIDAAVLWSNKKPAVAILGRHWKQKLIYLRNIKNPICVPDNDSGGLKNFSELAKELSARTLLIPHRYKDISEYSTQRKTSPKRGR